MPFLAINTSTTITQIALIENKIFESSWKSKQNEAEKLLPKIIELFKKANTKFEDLKKIIVIQGPGSFTALRVSIAVANALAYALKVPVIGINVTEYWKYRCENYKNSTKKNELKYLLYAGLNKVYFDGEIIPFDDFLIDAAAKNISQCTGVLRDNQIQQIKDKGIKWINEEDLKVTFGDFLKYLIENDFLNYKEESMVEPLYFSAPHITKSKKAYK
jgi:tRNA threonylcarbamoyladenosine biosynthesis protein TsaB